MKRWCRQGTSGRALIAIDRVLAGLAVYPPRPAVGQTGCCQPSGTKCEPADCTGGICTDCSITIINQCIGGVTAANCLASGCVDGSACAPAGVTYYGIFTAGGVCAGTDCLPGTLPDGSPCSAPSQCSSTFCVDGVCCNTACDQPSEQCNLPAGPPGTCSSTAAPAPALSSRGLTVAVMLLFAVSALALARRRRHSPPR